MTAQLMDEPDVVCARCDCPISRSVSRTRTISSPSSCSSSSARLRGEEVTEQRSPSRSWDEQHSAPVETFANACGCESRDGHVAPYSEDEGHGERSSWDADYGLTGPVHVPDTGFDYGTFRGQDDAYCYCGHPNYITCHAWLGVSYV